MVQENPSAINGGTLYLILIQVISRGLTFAGNQVLLRFLSPELLGIYIQFELLSVTVLYFSRESLRVALQRQVGVTKKETTNQQNDEAEIRRSTQAAINLSYLALVLGLLVLLILGYGYRWRVDSLVSNSPYFELSFRISTLATVLELCAEPSFAVIQKYSLYKDRARAETIAAIARCLFSCSTAFIMHYQEAKPSVLPFAGGQLAYGIVLFAMYLRTSTLLQKAQGFNITPTRIEASQLLNTSYIFKLFDQRILTLAATMYFQSIFKLLLTEGDTMILSLFSSLSDQGSFALASNYGGLLARLLFQPIEESSRNIFGRLLGTSSVHETGDKAVKDKRSLQEALNTLSTTLHFYLLLALPLFTIAPHLLPFLVKHIIGTRWSNESTSTLLATYCYYIPFMAINGILDALVTSMASPHELRQQSIWMALFTGLYGLVTWILLQKLGFGAEGLVLANMFNMTLRIGWSISFIRHWIVSRYHDDGKKVVKYTWLRALPRYATLVSAIAVAFGLYMSANRGFDAASNADFELLNLGYTITGGAVLLGTIMITERDFFLDALDSFNLLGYIPKFIQRHRSTQKDHQKKA